jgi:hypothetical protein
VDFAQGHAIGKPAALEQVLNEISRNSHASNA